MKLNTTQPQLFHTARALRGLALAWIERGSLRLRKLSADEEVSIGCAPDNTLVFKDAYISNYHCRIATYGGHPTLVDRQSTNGTWLNDERVSRRTLVAPGLIRVGTMPISVLERVDVGGGLIYYRFDQLVARNILMLKLFHKLNLVARGDDPVLILGPSGTGKELVATALHRLSARESSPFIPINCASLTAELAESELFGAKKGAYTGATMQREGLFGAADGGTLFMDEVGDLPAGIQAKLLRVLESGEIRPVGGAKPRHVDVRLISATNRKMDEPRFRQDLLHRLNTFRFVMPPLNQRVDDMLPLLHCLLDVDPRCLFSDAALERLSCHDWRGNVRELKQVVRRHLVTKRRPLGVEDLELDADSTVRLPRSAKGFGGVPREEAERILTALRLNDGNVSATYRALAMPRSTFYHRLNRIEKGLTEEQRRLYLPRRRRRR